MSLEKGEGLLVSLDDVMRKFVRFEQKNDAPVSKGIKMRREVGLSVKEELWRMWEIDYVELESSLKRKIKVGEKKS